MAEAPALPAKKEKDFKVSWKEQIYQFEDNRRWESKYNVAEKRQILANVGHCPHCAMSIEEQVTPLPITEILEELSSSSEESRIRGCRAARKLFCMECNPPLKSLDKDLVSRLVSFLCDETRETVRFEAAWALVNLIIQREPAHTQELVKLGVLPEFLFMAASYMLEFKVLGIVALAHIFGTPYSRRNDYSLLEMSETVILAIDLHSVPNILRSMTPETSVLDLRLLAWMMMSLCRYQNPYPSLSTAQKILPSLVKLLHQVDVNILSKASWALSYLSVDNTDSILKTGINPLLVDLMGHEELNVLVPAIRTVRNITKNSNIIQAALDAGIMRYLPRLMRHSNPTVQREAAMISSNIAAGHSQQIQELIIWDILPEWLEQLQNGDLDTQIEAALAVKNFARGATAKQIIILGWQGVLERVINLLEDQEPNITLVILEVISNMFKAAEKLCKLPWLCQLFDDQGGVLHLEMLLHSKDKLVYQVAHSLYDDYFTYIS